MSRPSRLIPDPPTGLRERARADGSVRIWWEPLPAARALGFAVVDLDDQRLTWSPSQAERLNAEVARAVKDGRRSAPAPGGRSIEALAETYRRSLAFTGLAPKTRASYDANLRLLIRKWGASPVRDFSKPVMRTWYETLHREAGEYQAVALLRMMSILFSHAELIGWRPEGTNPCLRLKMRTPAPRRRVANWAEVDALIAAADAAGLPSIGTAVLMSLLQGQRQTDIILARRGDFADVIMQGPGRASVCLDAVDLQPVETRQCRRAVHPR